MTARTSMTPGRHWPPCQYAHGPDEIPGEDLDVDEATRRHPVLIRHGDERTRSIVPRSWLGYSGTVPAVRLRLARSGLQLICKRRVSGPSFGRRCR